MFQAFTWLYLHTFTSPVVTHTCSETQNNQQQNRGTQAPTCQNAAPLVLKNCPGCLKWYFSIFVKRHTAQKHSIHTLTWILKISINPDLWIVLEIIRPCGQVAEERFLSSLPDRISSQHHNSSTITLLQKYHLFTCIYLVTTKTTINPIYGSPVRLLMFFVLLLQIPQGTMEDIALKMNICAHASIPLKELQYNVNGWSTKWLMMISVGLFLIQLCSFSASPLLHIITLVTSATSYFSVTAGVSMSPISFFIPRLQPSFPVINCLVVRLSCPPFCKDVRLVLWIVGGGYIHLFGQLQLKPVVTDSVILNLCVFYLVNRPKGPRAEDLDPFEFCLFQDAKLGLVWCCSTWC